MASFSEDEKRRLRLGAAHLAGECARDRGTPREENPHFEPDLRLSWDRGWAGTPWREVADG